MSPLLTSGFDKVLSVTCDNASVNDKMIEELTRLLPDFPGSANHTRCFLHILNLIAKTVISQFDTPNNMFGNEEGDAELLATLAKGIEREEEMTRESEGGAEEDDMEGWVDEVELLNDVEREELNASLVPIRLVIVKVSCWIIYYLLSANVKTASKTCLHDCEFIHTPFTSMEATAPVVEDG